MDKDRHIYEIPDNFVDSGRVIRGLFETRAFAEACVLGLIALAAALLIPIEKTDIRICVVIILTGPAFALGIMGINGDHVSTALGNLVNYIRTRKIMFFDGSTRALETAPVERMMTESSVADRVAQYIDRRKNERLERRIHQQYVFGENYTFATDTDYARDYIDTSDFGLPIDDDRYIFVEEDMEKQDDIIIRKPVSETDDFPFVPYIPSGQTGSADGTDVPRITVIVPDREEESGDKSDG